MGIMASERGGQVFATDERLVKRITGYYILVDFPQVLYR